MLHQSARQSVVGPLLVPVLLNVLGLSIIKPSEVIPRRVLGMEELVELGLDSLSVSMFGTLDEQGHQPGGNSCRP
jgi:hypothetical protein